VDTFFFLSGFLLSYLTLKELNRGKVKVLPAIALRYLRLTPSLALTMLVYYKIWVYLGYGPFAPTFQDGINRRCDGSWWSELTYTMNFVPFDSDKVCMGWSWYLGDDMIFFIIALLILPVYHARKWLGWCIIIVLTGMSFGVTTWLVVGHNLSIYPFDDHWSQYAYWAYSKPYTRIPAYFVGIVAAWALQELEQRGFTRDARPDTLLAKICATLAAGCAWGVILFLTFIVTTDFGDHQNSWGKVVSVLYINLSRPVWAMGWATITLLCYYDFMPLVNGFLAHRLWTPLARLTYGAYLVHPLVIKLAAGRSLQFYTFNSWDMIYRASGNIMMAYSGALVLWCLVERPCMTMLSPSKKPTAPKQSTVSEPSLMDPESITKSGLSKMNSGVSTNNSGIAVLPQKQGA
jgi:peptidoglycan/LPS O-acetylase OafA/YrhL